MLFFIRKKDCLRQFIVVLFERHELKALVEYPYPDMLDEVSIITVFNCLFFPFENLLRLSGCRNNRVTGSNH